MQLLNYTTAILAVTENGWGATAPPAAARRCQRVQTDSKFGSLTAGRYWGRLVLTLAVSQVAHTPGSRFLKKIERALGGANRVSTSAVGKEAISRGDTTKRELKT